MSDTPQIPASPESEAAPRDALELRLGRLPRELPPERDLWPEIAARLDGRRSRWRPGLGLAAGIAALAIVGVIALTLSRTAPRAVTAQASTGTSAPDGAAGAARAARDAAYLRTQAAVEQSFERELAHLPQATQIRLRQDLEIIRNARADIRRALDAAPEDPLLQQLFADTWQQEMDFYSNVATTNNPAGVRWPM
jgi:hypothetical protein